MLLNFVGIIKLLPKQNYFIFLDVYMITIILKHDIYHLKNEKKQQTLFILKILYNVITL